MRAKPIACDPFLEEGSIMVRKRRAFDFRKLIDGIREIHACCVAQASKAVNVSLTLRNWAIGCYIREYEQRGEDRAAYREQLLEKLAGALQSSLDRCYTGRYLRLCRQFYETYPQIRKSLISGLPSLPGAGLRPVCLLLLKSERWHL